MIKDKANQGEEGHEENSAKRPARVGRDVEALFERQKQQQAEAEAERALPAAEDQIGEPPKDAIEDEGVKDIKDGGTEAPKEKKDDKSPAKRKLIVDGEEVEFDEDTIIQKGISTLQKETAADKRLKEAADARKEARELLAAIKGLAPTSPPDDGQNSNLDGGVAKTSESDISLNVDSISKAIAEGDEAEVQEAVKQLLTASKHEASTINPDDIAALVEDKLAFGEAKKLLDLPESEGGFSDLYGNEDYRDLFIAEEVRLSTAEPDLSYVDRFNKAAGKIRKLFKSPEPTPPVDKGAKDKDQLKDDLGTSLTKSAAGDGSERKSQEPTTYQQKMAEARKLRGRL